MAQIPPPRPGTGSKGLPPTPAKTLGNLDVPVDLVALNFKVTPAFKRVRVRVAVTSGKSDAGFCAMAAQGYEEGTREVTLTKNQPNALTIMLTADGSLQNVTLRLIDCQTQLELAALADLPVKLTI